MTKTIYNISNGPLQPCKITGIQVDGNGNERAIVPLQPCRITGLQMITPKGLYDIPPLQPCKITGIQMRIVRSII